MNRARTSRFLPLVLLVSAAVWAASAADSHSAAGPETAGASYAVTFHVDAPSTVPDGATVNCRASIEPRRSVFEKLTSREAAPESTPGTGVVANSSALCTVMVPYAAAKSGSAAELSYHIDALTASGPVFTRTQSGIGVALPQPGNSGKLHLNVTL
jgi:hypothetical protein